MITPVAGSCANVLFKSMINKFLSCCVYDSTQAPWCTRRAQTMDFPRKGLLVLPGNDRGLTAFLLQKADIPGPEGLSGNRTCDRPTTSRVRGHALLYQLDQLIVCISPMQIILLSRGEAE